MELASLFNQLMYQTYLNIAQIQEAHQRELIRQARINQEIAWADACVRQQRALYRKRRRDERRFTKT